MQTKNTKNQYNTLDLKRIALWVGALTLVIESIALIVIGEFQFIIAGGMVIGLMAISTSLWPYIGMQKPFKDERSARIGAIAGLTSWYLTLVVACTSSAILGYVPDILFGFHPSLAQGFGGLIIIMVLTMLALYEYMIRKSDVELTTDQPGD